MNTPDYDMEKFVNDRIPLAVYIVFPELGTEIQNSNVASGCTFDAGVIVRVRVINTKLNLAVRQAHRVGNEADVRCDFTKP